jgi:hypothetical protein
MLSLLSQAAITGILPFTYFGGFNKVVGSSFLRATGVANNATDFEIWKHGKKYDNLIFQKVYWKEMLEIFKGPKILDLCDPDWLNGELNITEIGALADAVTCSSKRLTDFTAKVFPDKIVRYVPDRLDFKIFPAPKSNHNKNVKKIVWFGFIHNAYETLSSFSSILKKYNLALTVIADHPYSRKDTILELKPRFIQYDQRTVYSLLQDHDIVLNPKSDKASYRYKSNNKSVISWKLGLPVAESVNELMRFFELDERKMETETRQQLVNQEYNITKSIDQYKSIFKEIAH